MVHAENYDPKSHSTHLSRAHRCEIIAKLSKPNALSKWTSFDDANNEEYCVVVLEDVDELLEIMPIEEEPPIDDEI